MEKIPACSASLHILDFVRQETGRTKRLMGSLNEPNDIDSGLPGYSSAPGRRNHCLLDVNMVELLRAQEASVANPFAHLSEVDRTLFCSSSILKEKTAWPSSAQLQRKARFCGVKFGQYPKLINKLLEANMIKLLQPSDGAIENSIFGVWKQPNVSQRLIWSGDVSNQLFRDEVKSTELPTPDVISSLILDPG